MKNRKRVPKVANQWIVVAPSFGVTDQEIGVLIDKHQTRNQKIDCSKKNSNVSGYQGSFIVG